MPLALVIIAYLLVITGIKGNYADVGAQFETDVLNNGQGGGFLGFPAGLIGIAVFFRIVDLPNVGRVFISLTQCVRDQIAKGEFTFCLSDGRRPLRVSAEERVVVAEKHAEEDFGNDPAPDSPELRGGNGS